MTACLHSRLPLHRGGDGAEREAGYLKWTGYAEEPRKKDESALKAAKAARKAACKSSKGHVRANLTKKATSTRKLMPTDHILDKKNDRPLEAAETRWGPCRSEGGCSC